MTRPGGEAADGRDGDGGTDLATALAEDRTIFAAERTYASWVRTGLASLIAGVGGKALLVGVVFAPLPTVAAATLALFSAFCFAAAIWREVTPGFAPLHSRVRRLPPALLIAVNGVLVLVSLAAVYGVIAGR